MPLRSPPPGPPPLKSRATIAIAVSLDSQAVRSLMSEQMASVADVLELMIEKLKDQVVMTRGNPVYALKDGKSYQVTFKVALLESAAGTEDALPNGKYQIVMGEG